MGGGQWTVKQWIDIGIGNIILCNIFLPLFIFVNQKKILTPTDKYCS